MTQTQNRFLDELAKMFTNAAGAAQGVRTEVETIMRSQAERLIADLDLVTREENEALKARIAVLEAGGVSPAPKKAAAKATSGRSKKKD